MASRRKPLVVIFMVFANKILNVVSMCQSLISLSSGKFSTMTNGIFFIPTYYNLWCLADGNLSMPKSEERPPYFCLLYTSDAADE